MLQGADAAGLRRRRSAGCTCRSSVLLVALAGFAFHYLDAGRRWLAVTAIGLRLLSLVVQLHASART